MNNSISNISENAKAILLLTSPLLVGKGHTEAHPLTLTEYNRIARNLSDAGREPADLLRMNLRETLSEWQMGLDISRIDRLLERGFLLSQAIDRWQTRAIWVISRADDKYPQRLKDRLGPDAPSVLYGCGNRELLDNGGLAVVGSRNAGEELLDYSQEIGRLAADSGYAIISGAARGVDQAAMLGAFQKQGTVAGVLTGDLERESVNREHREMLMEGNLVLISPYDPKAGFNIGNAMQRNKLIYAFSDAALVVESDNNKGGTWSGAAEQLEKLHYVQIYVRSVNEISPGVKGLRRKGALAWPEPQTPDEFTKIMASQGLSPKVKQPELDVLSTNIDVLAESEGGGKTSDVIQVPPPVELPKTSDASPADALFATFECLIDPMGSTGDSVKEIDVIKLLQIEKKQAKVWLTRLVEEGKYKRKRNPVRYVKNFQPGLAP